MYYNTHTHTWYLKQRRKAGIPAKYTKTATYTANKCKKICNSYSPHLGSTILTTPDTSNKQYKHPPPFVLSATSYYTIILQLFFHSFSYALLHCQHLPQFILWGTHPQRPPTFSQRKIDFFTLTLANCFLHFYWRYLRFVGGNPYLIIIFSIKTRSIEYLIGSISKQTLFLLDFTFFSYWE